MPFSDRTQLATKCHDALHPMVHQCRAVRCSESTAILVMSSTTIFTKVNMVIKVNTTIFTKIETRIIT